MRFRKRLLVFVTLLWTLNQGTPLPIAGQAGKQQNITSSESPDTKLDLSGLGEEQTSLAGRILDDRKCDCGCGEILSRCLANHSACRRGVFLGNQVASGVKQELSYREIVERLDRPMNDLLVPSLGMDPDKKYEFSPAGAPFLGSGNAEVTIVHFLDYR
jgi:hypothetical protein